MVVPRGLREKGMESCCLMGIEFQFCKMKGVLEMDGSDGCTKIGISLIPLKRTLKNG